MPTRHGINQNNVFHVIPPLKVIISLRKEIYNISIIFPLFHIYGIKIKKGEYQYAKKSRYEKIKYEKLYGTKS